MPGNVKNNSDELEKHEDIEESFLASLILIMGSALKRVDILRIRRKEH